MVYEEQFSYDARVANATYFHTKAQFKTSISNVLDMSGLPPDSEIIIYYTGHGC